MRMGRRLGSTLGDRCDRYARHVNGSCSTLPLRTSIAAHFRQLVGQRGRSTWILTSYLYRTPSSCSFGLVLRLNRRKRFYMSCVAIFTVSSFFCGLHRALGSLVL